MSGGDRLFCLYSKPWIGPGVELGLVAIAARLDSAVSAKISLFG